MEQYVGMDGQAMVTVINASFVLGWLSNSAGGLADPDVALGLRVALSVSCLLMFALTVEMRELFSGHDFFEVLAIYFAPFMVAAALPWTIATALIPVLLLGGIAIILVTRGMADR